PGPAGEEVPQVFTLNVASGERTQVTHLPYVNSPDPSQPTTDVSNFSSDDMIVFASLANPDGLNPEGIRRVFIVKRDGRDLRVLPLPTDYSGRPGVHPGPDRFVITGSGRLAYTLPLSGGAGEPDVIYEVFVDDGERLLQVTNLHREDTGNAFIGIDK